MLPYENKIDKRGHAGLIKVEMKYYKVMIDRTNSFDQAFRTQGIIKEIATSQGKFCTTWRK